MQDKKNAEMMKEVRRARAEYARQWRKRNPGKQAEYTNRYWMRKVMRQNSNESTADIREDD